MVVNDNDDDDDDDENNKTNDNDDDGDGDNDDGATFVSKQELVTMERTHPALSVPPDAEDFFFRRQEAGTTKKKFKRTEYVVLDYQNDVNFIFSRYFFLFQCVVLKS